MLFIYSYVCYLGSELTLENNGREREKDKTKNGINE